ncbi:MAG: hypothetical protein ACI837_001986 [Crocinitomicaceae bacterium]|jgi:hypothetical protein
MLKFVLHLVFLFAFLNSGNAQELISTSGNFATGVQGSLSWSIGEPITMTASTASGTLTQGFQQSYDPFLGLENEINYGQLTIYPNPFVGELFIHNDSPDTHYHLYIHDAQLKLVREIDLQLPAGIATYSIDLSELNNGLYFLTLEIGEESYRVLKQIVKLDETY